MIERERVLKWPPLPAICGVAGHTIVAELSEMHIVFGMTANTCLRRTAKYIVDMAVSASYRLVLSSQLESGQVVIKDFGVPAFAVMALSATRAKCRWMRIIPVNDNYTYLVATITLAHDGGRQVG